MNPFGRYEGPNYIVDQYAINRRYQVLLDFEKLLYAEGLGPLLKEMSEESAYAVITQAQELTDDYL